MYKILKKIKVAFIDFEECLCISLKHNGWQEVYGDLSLNPYANSENCCSLPVMKKFLSECLSHGVTRVGVSDVNVGFGVGVCKIQFVEDNYGSCALNHFVHLSGTDHELTFVQSYCASQSLVGSKILLPNKCLIVTSNPESVKKFTDNGFVVMTPQELVVRLGKE